MLVDYKSKLLAIYKWMATLYDAGHHTRIPEQERLKAELFVEARTGLSADERLRLELFDKQLDDDYESGETFHKYEI